MSFNKITIVGYLGKNPDLRYTPQGIAVCNINVATTEKRKDPRTGEPQDITTWFRVTLWRRLAEIANQYLAKGKQVYVEGRLRQEEYTDRDGVKRTSLAVDASDLHFVGTKGDDASTLNGATAPIRSSTEEAQITQGDAGVETPPSAPIITDGELKTSDSVPDEEYKTLGCVTSEDVRVNAPEEGDTRAGINTPVMSESTIADAEAVEAVLPNSDGDLSPVSAAAFDDVLNPSKPEPPPTKTDEAAPKITRKRAKKTSPRRQRASAV
jgi:single-strand DNA-binding protein